LVLAVHEILAPTPLALATLAAEEAEPYPLPDLPPDDALAERIDNADNLVPRHDRLAGIGAHPFDRQGVTVADPAALDT
jgi:hypothetical protein